ncbi:MAG: hypothetical protein QGH15_10875 [Kiritimatiellia bacterium]|jgi:hypothetical protein|nr:hypothetical protein [Kiritimatiellia bacterium]
MGKSEEESRGKIRISSSGGGVLSGVVRFLSTALVILIIVMVAGLFVSRSEGCRSFLEGRFEQLLGTGVTIENSRVGWPYVLVLEKVKAKGLDDGDLQGFKAMEVRVSPTLRGGMKFHINRGVLTLVRQTDESWLPGAFARLGDLPLKNLAEVSHITAKLRKRHLLHISDGAIHWLGADGVPLASATGISFDMQPANVKGWRMYHYRLSVYNAVDPHVGKVHDVEREWLSSDDSDYIELHASSREMPASNRGFWEAIEQ